MKRRSFSWGAPLTMTIAVTAGSLAGCEDRKSDSTASSDAAGQQQAATDQEGKCDQGNGGIILLPDFCATVFADKLGHARHLAVGPTGDVYVNTWSSQYTGMKNALGGYVVALRDADRDGRADFVDRFGKVHEDGKPGGGTGIAMHRDAVYVEENGSIVSYSLKPGDSRADRRGRRLRRPRAAGDTDRGGVSAHRPGCGSRRRVVRFG